jgi:carboxypeptidase family protein
VAQKAPPAPPPSQAPSTANAIGVAYDSVRLRPMAGAFVRVDTSDLVVTADDDGRFHIERIPPGAHYLSVEHPILDTLGIRLRSATESYAAGETKAGSIGTPSAETLNNVFCTAAWRARGPAVLVGRVREADTDKPAVGAKVSLLWFELDLTGNLRRAPRVRETPVNADGTYRICGLPAGVEGRVQVMRRGVTSGDVPINFGEDLLAMRSITIAAEGEAAAVAVAPAPTSDSARATPARVTPGVAIRRAGTARLTGRVLNKVGKPLVGARVQLEGTTRAATTRPTGDFVLDSLPAGTQTVSARLLGYAPIEAAVDLSSRDVSTVTLTMEDFVPVLETVRVSAQRERALDEVGYASRKRMGGGWYMDGDEIKQRNAINFSDVLRTAPGLRVTSYMGRQMLESSRDPVRGCVLVWIDGTMWQQIDPGDIDDFVKPWELGAIEVYSPTTTPAQYQSSGRGSCTTVLAWTARRLDRKKR